MAVQKTDAKDCCGENLEVLELQSVYAQDRMTYFELVQDLEMNRVQVTDGNILQQVL